VINTGHLFRLKPFDPYPFSFLTLVVSLEAIFLTVFVLMTRNRMACEADKQAHLDLQVDLHKVVTDLDAPGRSLIQSYVL
jgi:uncharacterized membrane protein